MDLIYVIRRREMTLRFGPCTKTPETGLLSQTGQKIMGVIVLTHYEAFLPLRFSRLGAVADADTVREDSKLLRLWEIGYSEETRIQ